MTNDDLERAIANWIKSRDCDSGLMAREIVRLREQLQSRDPIDWHLVADRRSAALHTAETERDRLYDGIAGVRRWAHGLIAGNIEAQKVVDELDYVLAGKPKDKEKTDG